MSSRQRTTRLGSLCAFTISLLLPATAQVSHGQYTCPDDPTTYPNGAIEGPVTDPADGHESAVGIDGGGRFVIGFSTPPVNENGANEAVGLRFLADGTCVDDPVYLSDDATTHGIHEHVSVDMNRAVEAQNSSVGFGWIGTRVPSIWLSSRFVLGFVTDFESFTSPHLEPPASQGPFEAEVTMGIDDSGAGGAGMEPRLGRTAPSAGGAVLARRLSAGWTNTGLRRSRLPLSGPLGTMHCTARE